MQRMPCLFFPSAAIVECPALFVPVVMRETGTKGVFKGTREEAYARTDRELASTGGSAGIEHQQPVARQVSLAQNLSRSYNRRFRYSFARRAKLKKIHCLCFNFVHFELPTKKYYESYFRRIHDVGGQAYSWFDSGTVIPIDVHGSSGKILRFLSFTSQAGKP